MQGRVRVCRIFFRGAAVILLGMTAVFIVASIAAKARGIDISCGCFGHAGKNLSFASHLLIDFALLIAFLILLRNPADAKRISA